MARHRLTKKLPAAPGGKTDRTDVTDTSDLTGRRGFTRAALEEALRQVAEGRPAKWALARLPEFDRAARINAAFARQERASAALAKLLAAERTTTR
jgi:hypothetical protein